MSPIGALLSSDDSATYHSSPVLTPMARSLALLALFLTMCHARSLPSGNLIVGYATSCSEHIFDGAVNGVNVIIWFASSLVISANNTPMIQVDTQLLVTPTNH